MRSTASTGPDVAVRDTRGRPLRDLRVSVTDRCNFRCGYCMPREVFGEDWVFLPRSEILSFEEISRLVRIFARKGVRKVRITGGEPLLRADLPELVEMLSAVREQRVDGREAEGPEAPVGPAGDEPFELAMTTNGVLLPRFAGPLAEAGLDRVTVSLDSLDDDVFRRMNDADFPVARVLEGIDAACAAGLEPVKINAVVRRGVNDHALVDLARHFKDSGHTVRFIEFMDVGTTNGWRLDEVVPAAEIVERVTAELPAEPVDPAYPGEVARRWRFLDGDGEFGVISSVTRPFCGDCTRARLSADGHLYTCLFAAGGTDLRPLLRGDASDAEIAGLVDGIWRGRTDRYSEIRSEATPDIDRVEMSYIGG